MSMVSAETIFLRHMRPLARGGASEDTLKLLKKQFKETSDLDFIGAIAEMCVLYKFLCKMGLSDERGKSLLVPHATLTRFNNELLTECCDEVVRTYEACISLLGMQKAYQLIETMNKLHEEVNYLALMSNFTNFLSELGVFIDVDMDQKMEKVVVG